GACVGAPAGGGPGTACLPVGVPGWFAAVRRPRAVVGAAVVGPAKVGAGVVGAAVVGAAVVRPGAPGRARVTGSPGRPGAVAGGGTERPGGAAAVAGAGALAPAGGPRVGVAGGADALDPLGPVPVAAALRAAVRARGCPARLRGVRLEGRARGGLAEA